MATTVTPTSTIAPMVVIVGQTATGKSALALEIAERFGGELVCADSRTVYRDMDIGTAKPTPADRARVPHHCLDLVDPNQPFTVADFKYHADAAIADITSRGKLPILVGGTGLYTDAVLYDYSFLGPADPEVRTRLNALSTSELQKRLQAAGIPLPNNPNNPRHLVRALETGGQQAQRGSMRESTLVLGLQLEPSELAARVETRVAAMLQAGLEQEARGLFQRYGFTIPPLQTIGYQEWPAYWNGTQNLQQTTRLIIKNTVAYAKRQKTWFKRNNSVHWLTNRGNLSETVDLTTTFLSK